MRTHLAIDPYMCLNNGQRQEASKQYSGGRIQFSSALMFRGTLYIASTKILYGFGDLLL